MSTLSSFAGLPLPANTDILNMNQAMGDYAQGADSLMVPRFVDNASRDAIMVGITAGMMCAVNGVPQYYDGAAWNVFEDHVFVRKTADTSRASSVTPAGDPHLSLSLLGGYRWELTAYVFAFSASASNTNPGLLLNFTTSPTITSSVKFTQGIGTVSGNTMLNGSAVAATGDIANAYGFLTGTNSSNSAMTMLRIVMPCPATTAVTLSWAQATSNATPTVVAQDSFMVARRIVSL